IVQEETRLAQHGLASSKGGAVEQIAGIHAQLTADDALDFRRVASNRPQSAPALLQLPGACIQCLKNSLELNKLLMCIKLLFDCIFPLLASRPELFAQQGDFFLYITTTVQAARAIKI